jgi:hypothetical protein
MPFYPGAGQAALLNPIRTAILINTTDRCVGGSKTSTAVQFERQKSASYPFAVSYELIFSASPGTFEIDIQHSDTDTDLQYVTMNSVTNVNSNQAARVELPATWALFGRVKVVTLTNDVQLTVRVTR